MSSPHHPSTTVDTTTSREIQNEDLDDKVVLSQPPHVSTTPSSSSRICSRYTQLRKQLRSCSNFKENYFVMEMKVTSSNASQKGASRRNKCSSSTTKKRNKDQQEEQQQEGHELSDHNDLEKQHSQPMMKKKKQEDNVSLDTHAPAQEIQQQPCASLLASTATTMEMNHSQINSSFTHHSLVQEGLSQQMYDPSMMLRYWQLQMLNDIIEAIKTLHKNDHVSNHHDESNVFVQPEGGCMNSLLNDDVTHNNVNDQWMQTHFHTNDTSHTNQSFLGQDQMIHDQEVNSKATSLLMFEDILEMPSSSYSGHSCHDQDENLNEDSDFRHDFLQGMKRM